MKLSDWIIAQRLSIADLASILGVDLSTAWRWATGRTIPRKHFVARIAEITGGAVQPGDFYDLDRPQQDGAALSSDPEAARSCAERGAA